MAFPRILMDQEFTSCEWSEDEAVDKDVVNSMISYVDWQSEEGEEFLFTSPAVRYDFPYIGKINSWICITNKRIFFWRGKIQSLTNLAVPEIHEIDNKTLTRFRLGKQLFFNALVIKGRFFNGVDPSDKTHDETRKERVIIIKGVGKNERNLCYFQDAIESIGMNLGDPLLNTD